MNTRIDALDQIELPLQALQLPDTETNQTDKHGDEDQTEHRQDGGAAGMLLF